MNNKEELGAIESLRTVLINKQRDLIYKILCENGGSISVNLDEDGEPDEDNNPYNACTNICTCYGCDKTCDIHKVSILNDKDKTFEIEGSDIEYGKIEFGEAYPENYNDILTFITNMIEYNE